MPFVLVYWFKGRTADQKKMLAEAMTKSFVRIAGVRRKDVFVAFVDLEREDVLQAGEFLK